MAEFQDYMQQLKLAEEEREHMEQMLKEHEIWRQTTWSGWLVRQLQTVGVHIIQFIQLVQDAIRHEQNKNSIMGYVMLIILRIIGIAIVLFAFYILVTIFNYFISKEIIIVDEIIIDDTDYANQTTAIQQQQQKQMDNTVTKKQARRSKTKHS